MKRLFLTLVLAAGFFAIASAQTSLVGRVYYHPNIIADEMKNMQNEIDSKVELAEPGKKINNLKKDAEAQEQSK